MSLFSGISQIIAGAALIAGAVAVDLATFGTATPAIFALVTGGAGMIMGGIGTLISGNGPTKGLATTTRSSVAPWRIGYGQYRVGGTLVYLNMWGSASKVLDMVVVLAANACQSVDEVLFDQQRIQIDTTAIPTTAKAGYTVPAPAAGSGTSFTPLGQTVNIASIARAHFSVVTVVLNTDIPYLTAGDSFLVQNVTGDLTLNGTFQVAQIISRVPSGGTNILTFTYLCGGSSVSITAAGQVKTKWADYGRTVYVEPLLGNQTLGQSFVGMAAGTPWLGTGRLNTPLTQPDALGSTSDGTAGPNPWTPYCSLQGKTAVFIRLTYANGPNGKPYYESGIPQISFLVHGKNDIYDPRTATYGYTENPALCIADFLANTAWGYGAAYGDSADIPTTALAAAADVCDTAVTLARGGTEPMYTCNGSFELTMRRGEILQNLLTSCAGRICTLGGQFTIQPGYWTGGSAPSVDLKAIAAGPAKWRVTPVGRDLYNGVKGTFISPENKWQSTDFPYYAQDTLHGYSGPSMYGGDANVAADGGQRRWLDVQLPFTISYSMAQRIAKIELLRRRHWGTGTFALNMAGYQFAPLDIIEATFSPLGWSGKAVEITAARLRADKQENSILLGTEIEVQETDAAIYAWSTSEELSPQGYQEGTPPTWSSSTAIANEVVPYPWSPGYVAPLAGDAIYPQGATGPASFGVEPVYGFDAQGNATLSLLIKGQPPINSLDETIAPATISCTVGTSGSLAAGTYIVGLSAYDASGAPYKNSPYFNLAPVTVPSGGTGSITVAVTWGSGDVGGDLYVANSAGDVLHYNQTLSVSQATATITAFDQSTAGGPDPIFDHLSVTWQNEIHGGVWAQQVQAVTATTITIGGPPSGMTANQWAGYKLSLLAKLDPTVEVPILNMPVASNTASDATTGLFVLTIGPNSASVQLPDLTTLLAIGDVVVMRGKYTFAASSFSDANVANCYYPSGDTGVEAGHLAVVLDGADAGDVQTISGVTSGTEFDIAGAWRITPTTGDTVVVVAPSMAPEVPSGSLVVPNKLIGATVQCQPDVSNLAYQTWLFRVRAEDADGNYGPDALAPFRELWLFGSQGTRLVAASGSQLARDGTVQFDTSSVTGTTDTLAAAITDTTSQGITLTSGSTITGGTVIQIGTERMYILADPGATPTVVRGWAGTTAATHSNGATVNIGGALAFTLLAAAQVPNVTLKLNKVSSDINFVTYTVAMGSGDTLPGGGTGGILADNDTYSTAVIVFPGN